MDDVMVNLENKDMAELCTIFDKIQQSIILSEISLTDLEKKIDQLTNLIVKIYEKFQQNLNEINRGYWNSRNYYLENQKNIYAKLLEIENNKNRLFENIRKLRELNNGFNININQITLKELQDILVLREEIISNIDALISDKTYKNMLSKEDLEYINTNKEWLVRTKRIHQAKYNARVRYLKDKKKDSSVEESTKKISSYKTKYYKKMEYEELEKNTAQMQIDVELDYIVSELDNINNQITNEEIDYNKKTDIMNNLSTLYSLLSSLDVKIANEELTNKENYIGTIRNSYEKIIKIVDLINEKLKKVDNNAFKEIDDKISDIRKIAAGYINGVVLTKSDDGDISNILLDGINNKLGIIEKQIEDLFKTNKLDINQYGELIYKLRSIYRILPGNTILIEDTEKKVSTLGSKIDNHSGTITGNEKKDIESEIKQLENELEIIDKQLSMMSIKERKSKKGKELLERRKKLKEELKEIKKKFDNNRPLSIKSIKDGGEVYTKTEKIVMIAGGLAMMSLLFTPVGNLMVPPLVLAGLSLVSKYPVLENINNILGKVIGATKKEDGTWKLANGLELNSSSVIVSLLKSLVVSKKTGEVGSLVKKIKDLSSKISIKEHLSKVKESFEEKSIEERIAGLYRKYKGKLGLTNIEEFCKIEHLTEEEIKKFIAYVGYKEIPFERKRRSHAR